MSGNSGYCKCGQQLREYDSDFKCARCEYFEAIGVVTIQDYNNWLKGIMPWETKYETNDTNAN